MRIRRSAIGPFLFAILLSNAQFTSANAATFAPGTPCEVIASDSTNLTYSLNSGTRQCTYTFSYNATARTITLPTNLVSATITLTGARGGQGGPRTDGVGATASASNNSYVGIYGGTIPSPNNKQIEIHTGTKGGDGNNNSTASTGANPGPVGGLSSYSSGAGGGGGATGGRPASLNQGGTGGSGGGATVAVINSIPIFAGGGGGTGGSNRKASDTNISGGAAQSQQTLLTANSIGGNGGSYAASPTNTGATASGGGGGGGGGGFYGGSGGNGAWNNNSNDANNRDPTEGGYPGSNGTTYSLTATSNSYTQSISSATGSLGGVAVIVLVYKGTTTATLSIPTGDLVYRQAKLISLTSSVAGQITFTVAGKVLPGCKNRASNAANSYTVTCSYKPSTHSAVTITGTLDPTNLDYIGTVSSSAQFLVGNRTGPRAR